MGGIITDYAINVRERIWQTNLFISAINACLQPVIINVYLFIKT